MNFFQSASVHFFVSLTFFMTAKASWTFTPQSFVSTKRDCAIAGADASTNKSANASILIGADPPGRERKQFMLASLRRPVATRMGGAGAV